MKNKTYSTPKYNFISFFSPHSSGLISPQEELYHGLTALSGYFPYNSGHVNEIIFGSHHIQVKWLSLEEELYHGLTTFEWIFPL